MHLQNDRPPDSAPSHVKNPFADADVASKYENWFLGPGRRAEVLEKRLLRKLLATLGPVQTLLEVGCGTGHFTRWFNELGLETIGLDSSPAMLAEAHREGAIQYQLGGAYALPFASRSFDVVAMTTMLEFVADPVQVLSEAARVARHGLLLGVLNRQSLLTWCYRRSGNPLWHDARFFTPRELCELVSQVAHPRLIEVRWRTTLWPLPWITDLALPWGGLIGAVARLEPS